MTIDPGYIDPGFTKPGFSVIVTPPGGTDPQAYVAPNEDGSMDMFAAAILFMMMGGM